MTSGSDANWDNYSVQWDGYIAVPTSGLYLSLYSDDGSRMWIDADRDGAFEQNASEYLANSWGYGTRPAASAALAAPLPGTYPIRIQYEEGHGWNALGLLVANRPQEDGLAVVPSSYLYTNTTLATHGLEGSYVNASLRNVTAQTDWRVTQTISGTRVDAELAFRYEGWGARSQVGLTGGVDHGDNGWERFSVQWDGVIQIPASGIQLYTRSDDGARLWIDVDRNGVFSGANELVNNHWGTGGLLTTSGPSVALQAGNYAIRVQYEEGDVVNRMFLLWGTPAPTNLTAGVTGSQQIAIANPSFEITSLADGAWTGVPIVGWATTGGGESAGVQNWTDQQYSGANEGDVAQPIDPILSSVPQGKNSAYSRGGTISQVLGAALEPNSRYTLAVNVGRRVDNSLFPESYRVQLLAGGVVLAEDNNTVRPAPGQWLTSNVSFITGAAHPQLGQSLEIRILTSPDSTGNGGMQANYDNVRLSKMPAASNISVPSVSLDWDTVISAGNYFVERATSAGGPFKQVAILPANQSHYTDVGTHLAPGTTYYYRVRSVVGGVSSRDSAIAAVTTARPTAGFDSGPRIVDPSNLGTRSPGVSFIDVTFNEPINLASFTPAEVVLKRGTTTIAVQQPFQVLPNPTNQPPVWRIPFPALTTPGNYSLQIGPKITDLAGNRMNQDNDTINGEATADRYVAVFSVSAPLSPTAPLLTAVSSGASAVVISNPSFESQLISDGRWIGETIPGWTILPIGALAGTQNWTDAQFPGATDNDTTLSLVPDGRNTAYSRGGTITQLLNATLEANTRYVLNTDIGRRMDGRFRPYKIQLWAGGELLIEDDNSLLPQIGRFLTSTIQFQTGPSNPALGQRLEIRLVGGLADDRSGDLQVLFDNVRLSKLGAIGPPSPPAVALSWNGTITNGYYSIERATSPAGPFQEIRTVPAGQATFRDGSGLKANTTYYYRLRANSAGIWSDYSPIVSATTLPPSPAFDSGPRVLTSHLAPSGLPSLGAYSRSVDHVDLTFTEPIALASLRSGLSVSRDGAVVSISNVVQVQGNTYRVLFPRQTQPGEYRVTVAHSVTDLTGNRMNQNQLAPNGETTADRFVGAFVLQTDIQRPAVTLVSPNRGSLRVGETFRIEAQVDNPGNVSHVWIQLYKGGEGRENFYGNIYQASVGSGNRTAYDWSIGSTLEGRSIEPGNDYRIKWVVFASSPGVPAVADFSNDSFRISPAPESNLFLQTIAAMVAEAPSGVVADNKPIVSGVTIVSHGFQLPFGEGSGDSLLPLAAAIQERTGGWLLNYQEGTHDTIDVTYPPGRNGTEVVLVYDWYDESQSLSTGWAESAGDSLFAILIGLGLVNPGSADGQPRLHFMVLRDF